MAPSMTRSGRAARHRSAAGPCILDMHGGIHTPYPWPRGTWIRRRRPPVSVRNALLALLEQGPRYGYQLRAEFEHHTGGTWPLNVGQVYTTLARLERDGLVEGRRRGRRGARGVRRDRRRAARGRATWFTSPVPRTQPPRDELAIKLALAVTVPGVDVGAVIQQQRSATMTRAAGLHPAQAPQPRAAAHGRRHGRARLGAGPRLPGLRRRGRDPLARPLRGAAAPGRGGASARAATSSIGPASSVEPAGTDGAAR